MSVLVLLHMTEHKQNPTLQNIRSQLCGENYEKQVAESIELMIDWIRSLRFSDPISRWCYQIIQPLYHLEP